MLLPVGDRGTLQSWTLLNHPSGGIHIFGLTDTTDENSWIRSTAIANIAVDGSDIRATTASGSTYVLPIENYIVKGFEYWPGYFQNPMYTQQQALEFLLKFYVGEGNPFELYGVK